MKAERIPVFACKIHSVAAPVATGSASGLGRRLTETRLQLRDIENFDQPDAGGVATAANHSRVISRHQTGDDPRFPLVPRRYSRRGDLGLLRLFPIIVHRND